MKDVLGQHFGRLSVIARATSDGRGEIRWLCQCDCGNQIIALSSHLRNGKIVSCKCLQKERTSQSNRNRAKHGHCRNEQPSPTYFSWASMHSRCYRKENASWFRYGYRGIRVCARWFDFQNFLSDMGERPSGKTLDRIDNDGYYTPENCKWSTRSEQQRNRRKNHVCVS